MARLLILGASGDVGKRAARHAHEAGHRVTAQTRDAARLRCLPEAIDRIEADPRDAPAMLACMSGKDAVLYALGCRTRRPTTFFSDTTRVLVEAMLACGVRRLVAITGVGAGETLGHGGFIYDRLVFPLITRHIYADKNRQEALIAVSGLDWTVLRPAPFARRVPDTALEVHASVAPDLTLSRITRDEVARFAVGLIDDPASYGKHLFVGHR